MVSLCSVGTCLQRTVCIRSHFGQLSDSDIAVDASDDSNVAGDVQVAAPRARGLDGGRARPPMSGPLRLYVVVTRVSGLWPAIRFDSEWPDLPDNADEGLPVGFVLAEAWSIQGRSYSAQNECHREVHQHIGRQCHSSVLGFLDYQISRVAELVALVAVGLSSVGDASGH